jgi:hypothetical protein
VVVDGTVVDIESDGRLFGGDIAVRWVPLVMPRRLAHGEHTRRRKTYKDTSCFQTGLWADILDPKTLAIPLFAEPADELGVCSLLEEPRVLELSARARPLLSLLLRAPRTDMAFEGWAICDKADEDEFRERLVATPLISLSVSSVGSRETNSFCSNWTTT